MELKVIPIVQVAIAAILMTLLQYFLPALSYSGAISPSTNSILVMLLLFIAILIGFFAIDSFRKHQTTVNPSKPETSSKVVDNGIYQYSRNPMYLAMLLLLISYACYLENPLTLAIVGLFVWYIGKYQITPEERILTSLFGQAYSDYKNSVRRWL
ncbi:methyltransferase family protein [Colwellia sp. C1TZA3]|uniref:methyltransferase family protein n=1 Tax=Colwellia sp. C1TZA3 TaxID=2508879 RepID=UPI00174D87C1|nr:isoprenylcysteine carboxylmethyltransferase family protein [Colwellia sp. C1TZA3]